MAKLFISYRREDTATAADRLYAELGKKFGKKQIFMDFKSLKAGSSFVEQIKKQIKSSSVLLVIIGSKWLQSFTEDSPTNQNTPSDDYVLVEIETAQNNGIPVIPVLVEGATMPEEKDLPITLKDFTKLHAFELDLRHWKHDIKSLISAINEYTGDKKKTVVGGIGSVAGGTAGAIGTNAGLAALGTTVGLSATPAFVAVAAPILVVAGGGLAAVATYKGLKRLLNKV